MGEVQSGSNMTYFKVIKGKLATRVSADDPRAEERHWEDSKGNKGVTIERYIKAYEGVIVDIFLRESDYGLSLCLVMDGGDDKPVQIQVGFDTRLGTTIMYRLKNIDYTKNVTISPFYDKENERSAIAIFQNGTPVPAFFTKNGPHTLPAWKQDPLTGKWDNSECLMALKDMIEKEVQPVVGVTEVIRGYSQFDPETGEIKSSTETGEPLNKQEKRGTNIVENKTQAKDPNTKTSFYGSEEPPFEIEGEGEDKLPF